jgi:hypothetical protein
MIDTIESIQVTGAVESTDLGIGITTTNLEHSSLAATRFTVHRSVNLAVVFSPETVFD